MNAGLRNAENEHPSAPWQLFCEQSQKMFKINFQRTAQSHFGGRPKKCSQRASRGFLGAILRAGPRNVKNGPPEISWELFGKQSPDMLKMNMQRSSGSHSGTRVQKYSKEASKAVDICRWPKYQTPSNSGVRQMQTKPCCFS